MVRNNHGSFPIRNNQPLTLSLRVLPALNAGAFVAGIVILSLVRGTTPVRSLRSLTSKTPKPDSDTFSPDAREHLPLFHM